MLTPSPLFPVAIRLIRLDHDMIVLDTYGLVRRGRCPTCGATSARVHDRYRRSPTDLPWRTAGVRLCVTVRRFCCDNPACPRRTFAEDFGPRLARGARRTTDVHALLVDLAESAGGEAGARLARAAGLSVSPDTLLRLLRHSSLDGVPTPRVLGVDDLALRRRHTYATILVDLETHRPIDLLQGRDVETLASWLRAHPGIQIIVRDRAEAYAEGARLGAPDAVQVADRFHLVQNASRALEEVLKARRRRIAVTVTEPTPPPDASRPLSPRQQQIADRRAARIARWREVRRRHAAGESVRHIAQTMGINPRTATWMAHQDLPPEQYGRHPRPTGLSSPSLQPYVTYLQDRWEAGCTNISQLYREISARGYAGSRSLLSTALQAWRSASPTPKERKRTRYVSVRWLCLRPLEDLRPEEEPVLEQVLADDTDLACGYRLLQRFRTLIAHRSVSELETWLQDATASGLAPFVSLANGIRDDAAAVEAALTTTWSNGPVEGHVHRVKLLKRQGYGRTGFALLRRRVLAA